LPRDKRRTVVKGHAAAQVERVAFPVRGDVPPVGQCRLQLGVRREACESVKDIGHRASGRHVGGERGVKRSRIVAITRINDRMPLRERFAALARSQREYGDEEEATPGHERKKLAGREERGTVANVDSAGGTSELTGPQVKRQS